MMDNVRMDYYTADWCGPCRFVKPIINELKAAGWNIEIINSDQNKDKVALNSIMGIPTFLIYKDDVLVSRITGARAKSELLGELNKAAG